jgi:hypothetical protein
MSTHLEADFDAVLEKWLVDHHRTDLFHIHSKQKETGTAPRKDVGVHLRLNLAGVSRMRMRKLQAKLAERILQMHYHEDEPKDWEDLLDQYSELLQ